MITRVEGVKTAVYIYGIHFYSSQHVSGVINDYLYNMIHRGASPYFKHSIVFGNMIAQRGIYDHYNTSRIF